MTKQEIAALDSVIYLYQDRHLGEVLRDIQIRMRDTKPQCELLKTAAGTVNEMQVMDFLTDYDAALFTRIEDMLERRTKLIAEINKGVKEIERKHFPEKSEPKGYWAPPAGLS